MSTERRPAVISAVVVAAGRGRRMGAQVPKPYLELGGLPILCRTLIRLQQHLQSLREIIVVVNPEDREGPLARWERHITAAGATALVDGGATRQESVMAGVAATVPAADLVLVHDAVRPFFPPAAVIEACRQALRHDGAVLAVPVGDTLKREGADRQISETVDRKSMHLAQTPQVFKRDLLIAALRRAQGLGQSLTDDAQAMEEAGYRVALVASNSWNLKITCPDDLVLARSILAMEEQGRGAP